MTTTRAFWDAIARAKRNLTATPPADDIEMGDYDDQNGHACWDDGETTCGCPPDRIFRDREDHPGPGADRMTYQSLQDQIHRALIADPPVADTAPPLQECHDCGAVGYSEDGCLCSHCHGCGWLRT